ncbi:hypothetical protein BUALT_Bualt03G0006300 [Buddleja alternifolia]|uniref:Uncharacterized protein n=1 Tax=Buddleja alternifolia TaxID=168488 RepID=A0AAV6XUF8_9LAMI|nr:hypothetical protein BUALT_Bualt03G0006300 [Buddleja alternifolia]
MTHLALPWWPKTTSTTTPSGGDSHERVTAASTTSYSSRTENTSSSASCCTGLSKLMRRLKKRSKLTLHTASRQSSFQCRYDPLSYSLNFDRSGSGDVADEDYYKFYAFSSRFVATPRTDCQRLVAS